MARKKRKKSSKKTYRKRSYSRRQKKNLFNLSASHIITILLIVIVGGMIIFNRFFRTSPDIPTSISPDKKKVNLSSLSKAEVFDYNIEKILNEYQGLPAWISKKDDSYLIRLPNDVPAIVLINEIMNKMEKLDYNVISSTEDILDNNSTIEIGIDEKVIRKVIITEDQELERTQGKIAIVIDDFGYNEGDDEKKLLQFPYPITVAIIPGTPKSKSLYEEAQKNKKETIIHLPMEAIEKPVEYSDYTIFENMSDVEIQNRVKKAIDDFPNSKGINNHMGSKITKNKHIMELVLDELKKQNKYFIDSKTTGESIAYQTAKELRVPCAENNMFLERDRDDDPEYLIKKLTALTKIASKNGSVLAIGHPYKNTINVLMEEIPKLEKQGFLFVPASEILE